MIYDDQHHDDDFHHRFCDELGCDDCNSLHDGDYALYSDCGDSFDDDNDHSNLCDDGHDDCVHDDYYAHVNDDDDALSNDDYDVDACSDHDPHLLSDDYYDCMIDYVCGVYDTVIHYDDHHDIHQVLDNVLHNCHAHNLQRVLVLHRRGRLIYQHLHQQRHQDCQQEVQGKQANLENWQCPTPG